ncbi:MAG TPA: hypothetical protein VN618_08570 [Solirubrobacteraceae bacterium]|nr:hypothetical protein [Solirubrobacteraceae bacterium]
MPGFFRRKRGGSSDVSATEEGSRRSGESLRIAAENSARGEASEQAAQDQARANEDRRQASDAESRRQAVENETRRQASDAEARRQAEENEARYRSQDGPRDGGGAGES